jgi:hypothetical protein
MSVRMRVCGAPVLRAWITCHWGRVADARRERGGGEKRRPSAYGNHSHPDLLTRRRSAARRKRDCEGQRKRAIHVRQTASAVPRVYPRFCLLWVNARLHPLLLD